MYNATTKYQPTRIEGGEERDDMGTTDGCLENVKK
jgi:hypothetical protein